MGPRCAWIQRGDEERARIEARGLPGPKGGTWETGSVDPEGED